MTHENAELIRRPEDLFNETLYYLEIKPHKAEYNMAEKTERELYHIVPYGFNIIHTVKRRCSVRIDAEYACNHKEIKYDYPYPSYNVWWRCWTEKPTKEQMDSAEWC